MKVALRTGAIAGMVLGMQQVLRKQELLPFLWNQQALNHCKKNIKNKCWTKGNPPTVLVGM